MEIHPVGSPTAKKPFWKLKKVYIPVCVFIALTLIGQFSSSPKTATVASKTVVVTVPPTPTATTPVPVVSKVVATIEVPVPPIVKITTKAPPKTKPTRYPKLVAHSWKLLIKNPDAYADKTYTVYGEIHQFDAATGTGMFLANASYHAVSDDLWSLYGDNTQFDGDASDLSDFVAGDTFRATIRVVGASSYDTQIGGSTTVPEFQIVSIKVI